MPNNLTDTEENRLLDLSLIDGDLLALTTTLPTDAAAGTEVTGGSYARQVIDWAVVSAGSKTTAADLNWTDMPAVTVLGWEVWDAAGTARKWYGLFSPFTASADDATDVITVAAHGLQNGSAIVFQSGYTPGGLTAGTVYYARDVTASTFKVAATNGGAALGISTLSTVVFGKAVVVAAGAALTVVAGTLTCTLT